MGAGGLPERLPDWLPVSWCAQRVHAHGASLKLEHELDALENIMS